MTSSKQVNIRKNLIQSITNIPCDDFGQTTDLGVFSAYLYTPESCDGLQRHDHVMLPKGVLITVETPVSKRVSLNHPYRFNYHIPAYSKPVRGTPVVVLVERRVMITSFATSPPPGGTLVQCWHRFDDAWRIRSCGDFWCKQHSFIVRPAVFLRRVVVDFCHRWTG